MVHRGYLAIVISWIVGLVEGFSTKPESRPSLTHVNAGKVEKERDSTIVSTSQKLHYEREGHTMLRDLVSGTALKQLTKAVKYEYDFRALEAYNEKLHDLGVGSDGDSWLGAKAVLAEACRKNNLPMPTLQVYNLHRANRPSSKHVYDFVTSKDLGKAAADLMGVD